MKNVPVNHRAFLYLTAIVFAATIVLVSACEKEAKSVSTLPTENASRTSESVATLTSLSARIDTGGLVAWFSFDSGSLRDISSYSNKVIFNNAQPTTDRNGIANNAFKFNGSSNFMAVKNSASLNPETEITLFTIAKFDGFYAGQCHGNRIFFKGDPTSTSGVYFLGSSDSYYTHNNNCFQAVDTLHQCFEADFSSTGNTDTTQFVQPGHWYHLVYTFGKGVAKYYVDGKLVATTPMRLLNTVNTANLYIGSTTGKSTDLFPYWFNGSIDQVGIFNKALNAAQVAKLSSY